MPKWLKDHGVELFIAGIVLVGFWHTLDKIDDIRAGLIRQESRTDNIVAALPDLRTRVAFESLHSKFMGAVFITKAFEDASGWSYKVRVLDAAKGKAHVYKVHAKGPDDLSFPWSLYGGVMEVDKKAINFYDMKNMAVTMKYEKQPPRNIVLDSSFVMYSDPSKIQDRIKSMGAVYVATSRTPHVKTWPQLMTAFETNKLVIK